VEEAIPERQAASSFANLEENTDSVEYNHCTIGTITISKKQRPLEIADGATQTVYQ
jgi:hypothetical protein